MLFQITVHITHYYVHLSRFSVMTYNQRGPLETPFFRHFLRLVLSCINADFCVQGRIFQHFSSSTFFPLHHSRLLWFFKPSHRFLKNLSIFADFQRQQILQIFTNFNGILPEFRRISIILQRVIPRLLHFREIWEQLQKICCKFPENLSQKMYALNVFGGNRKLAIGS